MPSSPADERGDLAETNETLGRDGADNVKSKLITPKLPKKRRKFGRTTKGRNQKSNNIVALRDGGGVDGIVSPTQPASTVGTQSDGKVPKRIRWSTLQKIQRSNDAFQMAAAKNKQNMIDDANEMNSLKSEIKTLTETFAQEKTNLSVEKENMLVDHQEEIDKLKKQTKDMADAMQSQRKTSNLVIII